MVDYGGVVVFLLGVGDEQAEESIDVLDHRTDFVGPHWYRGR
jgi:hypothetical protein